MDNIFTQRRQRKTIEISTESIILLKQKQQKAREVLGKDLTYDEIIKLSIDAPIVIIGDNKPKPQRKYRSIFDIDIGDNK